MMDAFCRGLQLWIPNGEQLAFCWGASVGFIILIVVVFVLFAVLVGVIDLLRCP